MDGDKDPMMGKKAPDLCLPDESGKMACSKDLKGRWTVLYFYPKDDTSGCTLEAKDFSCMVEDFSREGAAIIGVSPDPADSHMMFIGKHDLKVRLLSDEDNKVMDSYGVWKEKSMYGKSFMGVERSTFLIDPDLKIRKVWRKVKVEGHVQEVLETLRSMKKD
ncbi:MAG: peroxiredoxin [Candidatus Thermoplasmatota archaeon]|jgi:peroxiredoxin Q/BCP|nr:peroxiredoxin [Candidatus Thermoplasmatota archaeon]